MPPVDIALNTLLDILSNDTFNTQVRDVEIKVTDSRPLIDGK